MKMKFKFKLFSIFKRKKGKLEDKDKSRIKHQEFLQQEYAESKKEKREAESITQKMLARKNKNKEILAKEKTLGRTRGKPTHGPRGNKNE